MVDRLILSGCPIWYLKTRQGFIRDLEENPVVLSGDGSYFKKMWDFFGKIEPGPDVETRYWKRDSAVRFRQSERVTRFIAH